MPYLAQHFLKNESAIRNIVAALEIKPGDTIIEIGPGAGALTFPLLKECELRGAKLNAIERDRKLARELESQITNYKLKNAAQFQIIADNALKVLPTLLRSYASTHYKIVGNIPYYITGKLLRILSELEEKPDRTVLMIQKEVAQRIAAKPPEMNLLAAAVQFWAEPKLLFSLKPKEFSPPPKVDSAIIQLNSYGQGPTVNEFKTAQLLNSSTERELYYRFIRVVFKQPRKTLGNNLTAGFPSLSREKIEQTLEKMGLKSSLRAQNLSLENLVQLSRIF